MQNIQNKIDRLIQSANSEFSKQNNVVSALVLYSRAFNLMKYISRYDKIQLHEILVRMAISWDILGNYESALDCLSKALDQISNVSNLLIYKSVLERSLNKQKDSISDLQKYHKILRLSNNDINLYLIFKIVYQYINGDYERDEIINQINDYFDKFKQCTILLFLRAKMNYEKASEIKRSLNKDNEKDYRIYIKRYENDISTANQIETNDTACLIRDGITGNNLTKLFFMILPEMDYYQPKPLVNYTRFQSGFKLFYVLKKVCKIFNLKIKKRKIKEYYVDKIKKVKYKYTKNGKIKNILQYSNNSLLSDKSMNKSTSKSKSKSPVDATGRNINKEEEEIKRLKLDYETNVRRLYKSSFLKSKNLYDSIDCYDFESDISINYFIRNKFYVPFNISKNILGNEVENALNSEGIPAFGQIIGVGSDNFLNDLSVSVIKLKKDNVNDISELNDIKLLEKNTPKFVKSKNILSMVNLNSEKNNSNQENKLQDKKVKTNINRLPLGITTNFQENPKKRKISPDIVISNIKYKLLTQNSVKKENLTRMSNNSKRNIFKEKSFD